MQQPVGSRKDQEFIVGGTAQEGSPAISHSERLQIEANAGAGEVRRTETTVLTDCPSCGGVIHTPQELGARCLCRRLVCRACSNGIRCANEKCLQPTCPPCRERISGEGQPAEYLCLEHHAEYLRERMIVGVAVLVALGVLVLFVFLVLR